MLKLIPVCLIPAAMVILLSCEQSTHPLAPEPASDAAVREHMEDDLYEVPPARDTMSKVMEAKLSYSQAMLEAIALADFAQVENDAKGLKRISQDGEWLAHETPSYLAFSNEFREICDDFVNHARARNLQALAADYANLTNSCVACHSYLRAERPYKDVPGKVSFNSSHAQP